MSSKPLPACLILAALGAPLSAATAWETAAPESLGLNRARLEAATRELAARGTKAFLVARRGRIVWEWYASDHGPGKPHYTASLAKALVGGMSLLIALNDGRLNPDDPAWKYIPAWKDDPLRSRITIRHLATHSSGIEDAEEGGRPHNQLPGWKGAFWKQDPDPFSISIRQAPVIFEPGSRYAYSNPGMAALAYAVTSSLRGAPQQNIRDLLRERLMDPLGVDSGDWSVGYGKTHRLDGLDLHANWGGGSYTARAAARVGQLMLQRGEWRGARLVSPEWVDRVTRYAGAPLPNRPANNPQPGCGLAWYTNFDGVWPRVPRDAFAGAGAGNQVMLVVPSLDMIIVRNGQQIMNEGFWLGVVNYLFNPVMEALQPSPAPYPPSAAVRATEFSPLNEIACAAPDSDNWPLTWADDGDQYTSYGDGRGFPPFTETKLSQGFAKIAGPPGSFQGINIRSPSGERLGDGARGPKASGLLMADGVLYLWVRNTGNAQLAWSEDRGRTWQWGFRLETSFGSPAFLNAGQNYSAARDGYVYTYSQDGPSAYESYDSLVLARVPRRRIRERSAYEFFVRLDAGRPVWSPRIEERGPVFHYPGHCQRVDALYNPGLGRYLLALGYNHSGGWGLFDAPHPWGPWTTVFHTDYWGLGDTHGYRLPAKWISPDGRTLHLVFSGRRHNARLYDAFCVRRLTLAAR